MEGRSEVDLPELVAKVSESLAELIMLAPEEAWAALLADAIRHLGHTILSEKESGGTDAGH